MQVTIKAHFNKYTKDSKKQLVQFYVKGEDEDNYELSDLCREVVTLSIKGIDVSLTTHFCKMSTDDKKTVLDFLVKGDKSSADFHFFTDKAGKDVELTIAESQMKIEDFKKSDHEGIKYKTDGAEVIVDKNQAALIVEGDALKPPLDPMANVTNIKDRAPRVTKAEKEAARLANEAQQSYLQQENKEESEDDLPM